MYSNEQLAKAVAANSGHTDVYLTSENPGRKTHPNEVPAPDVPTALLVPLSLFLFVIPAGNLRLLLLLFMLSPAPSEAGHQPYSPSNPRFHFSTTRVSRSNPNTLTLPVPSANSAPPVAANLTHRAARIRKI